MESLLKASTASKNPKNPRNPRLDKIGGRLKRVLSAPKSLKDGDKSRRKSLSQLFKPNSGGYFKSKLVFEVFLRQCF